MARLPSAPIALPNTASAPPTVENEGLCIVAQCKGKIEKSMNRILTASHLIVPLALVLNLVSLGTKVTYANEGTERTNEILIGMSTALTGPAADLGIEVRDGVKAAFAEANSHGGIHGRKLRLRVLDDGYEPSRTAPNMRKLIETDRVCAVIGNVGTPTAIASVPIVNSTRTPFFGAYTGAAFLRRSPPDRYVINYRASYAEETAAMVEALVKIAGIKPEEIAFFTQRDGYGDAGFSGGIDALQTHGVSDTSTVAHGRYERNTDLVEKGLAEILFHRVTPKAVVMVGAYQPCAKFIRLAREAQFSPLFLNVSFVGSRSLAKTLGPDGDGVIVTQVVPHPNTRSLLGKDFRAALRYITDDRSPSHGSFEGYISARILIHAIESIPGRPERESVIEALEGLGPFQIGSLHLCLSAEEHQASHFVWPTVLSKGRVVPFNWQQLVDTESEGS